MSDEIAFLTAILANPKDDAPRLVYADWLEEQVTEEAARKAAFIRGTLEQQAARSELPRAFWREKLRALAPGLPPEWLATVSKSPIEACEDIFAFCCPKQWENLRTTDDPHVRHCDACDNPVHFSSTIEDARAHARLGECVALSIVVRRIPGDLSQPLRLEAGDFVTLGRLLPQEVPAQPSAVDPPPDRRTRRARRPLPRRERRRPGQIEEED